MLSVAFAELWPLDPLDGENEAFWLALAEAAAAKSLAGQLSAADAANCGVAFAATQLPAEQLTAALQLSKYAEDVDLSPQTCCALLLTHGYAGLWAPRFLEAMTKQIPDLLWQATDSIVCRWALATYLSGGRLSEPLREAVASHVLRQAKALEAGDESDEASLIASCQGAAALLVPEMSTGAEAPRDGSFWLEVTGPSSAIFHCARATDADSRAAGAQLARQLVQVKPRLGRLLQRLSENTNAQSAQSGARLAGLSALLLPSVKAPAEKELPKTLSAARRLSAFLRRFVAPRFPAPATASAVTQFGTVVVLQPAIEAKVSRVVFIVDDSVTAMYPGEDDAGLRRHPDAELCGYLLAKEGVLVLRLWFDEVGAICAEDAGPQGNAQHPAITVESAEPPPFASWLLGVIPELAQRLKMVQGEPGGVMQERTAVFSANGRAPELHRSEAALRRLLEVVEGDVRGGSVWAFGAAEGRAAKDDLWPTHGDLKRQVVWKWWCNPRHYAISAKDPKGRTSPLR
ncbi:unnamed protein product [Cladocopium goreaui]|uniref:Uncharacterized protein n=1 Tax=Cladocopium goreaui TaxID=2562237 RepID=A0A9P1CWR0_9DINO|nr:unnamed protein product [Cladocopium goreaui]